MLRRLMTCLLLAVGLGAPAADASAQNHLILLREVSAGSLADPAADYVELQMYSPGQNLTSGTKVTVSGPGGTTTETPLPDVSNGENQRTILVGSATVPGADAVLTGSIDAAGGQVCFSASNDCIAWGSFVGPASQGLFAGSIPAGQSLERSLAGGSCSTALDPGDDTNQASDFTLNASPQPRNNGMPPAGTLCTGTGTETLDTTAPSSTITRPGQRKTYAPGKIRTLKGRAVDTGGSQISEVEIALQKKMQNGSCRWWNGSRFVTRSCGAHLFLHVTALGTTIASGPSTPWEYRLSKALAPSVGTRVKHYRLFARSTDTAGNLESLFEGGRNLIRFEVS